MIRSLVPGGAAEQDGRLHPGHRLMSVNDTNLEHATLDIAVQTLKSTERGMITYLYTRVEGGVFLSRFHLLQQPKPYIADIFRELSILIKSYRLFASPYYSTLSNVQFGMTIASPFSNMSSTNDKESRTSK